MRGPDTAEAFDAWLAGRGWEPLPFQRTTWTAWRAGASGLVHAPTGVGKTLALWGGAIRAWGGHDGQAGPHSLRYLWITPLRALARDTVRALREPVDALGLPWSVELRTGDTPSSLKARQRTTPPTAMVTTPESLSLLLSYRETRKAFEGLEAVVVDEWHELLGNKRGVQTELCLARLRRWVPGLRTWGLSATLGNLDEAMAVLLGPDREDGRLVRGPERPPPEVDIIVPDDLERFPWAGHIGLRTLPAVLEVIEEAGSTLLFTNTRSQAEIWFRALVEARPDWAGSLALHHGSLDRAERTAAEEGLARGTVRCVVATSSLDLGVDFGPVDRVVQVGSPKGVGRLLQRAGRSGHRPGERSRITCVPTHAFEVAEFVAAREAMAADRIEARRPVVRALDVLAQHVVTLALTARSSVADVLAEARSTHAFSGLAEAEWSWVLDFVGRGGPALKAYPRYAKVRVDEDGVLRVDDRGIARRHRMTVGTITSDGMMDVRFLKGGRLGSIEEGFVARLRPGDTFLFAGRRVSLVRVREMTAYVRLARGSGKGRVPRWLGGKLPLSSELGGAVADVLQRWEDADGAGESAALSPLLAIQSAWSALPGRDHLLVERARTREGHHLFLFPFLGRFVHDGMAALFAWRLTRDEARTVHVSANDYGFELASRERIELDDAAWRSLMGHDELVADVLASINSAELARRRFRDIARIAGLVFPGFPGQGKSARQIQSSSGLIYDVLERYDAQNLLLDQARREVLDADLQVGDLRDGLARLGAIPRIEVETRRLTPLAFPIWAERVQARVSSESWRERVSRMSLRLAGQWDRERARAG